MLTLFDLARGLNNQMSVQDAGDVIAKHLRRLVPTSLLVFFCTTLNLMSWWPHMLQGNTLGSSLTFGSVSDSG